MACCGQGKPKKAAPIRQVPAPKPPERPKPITVNQKAIVPTAPPGSVNPPGKYCTKCGWIIAISKFVDPATGQIIEKRSCTNRRCVDY